MLQYADITVAVNKIQPVGIPGRYVYYLSGSAGGLDQTITIRSGNTGSMTLLKPGQSFRLADADKSVDTFYIGNYANAATIIGTLLIGDGDFQDNRVSGSVEVIDGGKNRSLAGNVFMVGAAVGAAIGNCAAVQLWNPVGSGKNLIVEKVSVSINGGTNAIADFGKTTAALPNAGFGIVNKNFGSAAASVASAKQQNAVAALPMAGGQIMYSVFLTAGYSAILPLNEPIIVSPGSGLCSQCEDTAVSHTLTGSFEWFEENI